LRKALLFSILLALLAGAPALPAQAQGGGSSGPSANTEAQRLLELKRLELALNDSRAKRDRAKLLYDQGLGSQADYDAAEINFRQAQVDFQQAFLRLFADTRLRPGAEVTFALGDDEGVLVYPLEGRVELDDAPPSPAEMGTTAKPLHAYWEAGRAPAGGANPVVLSAEGSTLPEGPREMAVAFGRDGGRPVRLLTPNGPARVIRVVFGRGEGDIVVA